MPQITKSADDERIVAAASPEVGIDAAVALSPGRLDTDVRPESTPERLKQMAAHIARQKPEGMTTPWWRY